MNTPTPPRNAPVQTRSQERLRQLLDAAEAVLTDEGAEHFTTTNVARVAGLPVGAIYRFFPDKDAIATALAVRYWSDFEDSVSAVADADGRTPFEDPVGQVLNTLAAGFRANPGFLELWYGGLRTERVRDATRPAREAIAGSIARLLSHHWPRATADQLQSVAVMVVLAGDGLLREAFRRDPSGERELLSETETMLDAYITARLGKVSP
jgi:AcrR family transcriptional regulator